MVGVWRVFGVPVALGGFEEEVGGTVLRRLTLASVAVLLLCTGWQQILQIFGLCCSPPPPTQPRLPLKLC